MITSDLRRWAVVGAQQRLVEIANEQRAIFAAFPELRSRGRSIGETVANNGEDGAKPKRRRRKMSAAARKAVSERMTKYWAARRGGGTDKSTPSGQAAAQANDKARGPRKMSSAARKRISDAQKARWAKQKAKSSSNANSAIASTTRRKGRGHT